MPCLSELLGEAVIEDKDVVYVFVIDLLANDGEMILLT